MKENIFIDRIRDIFAILDRGIYSLITIFYDTIEQLAVTPILSAGQINALAMNIYGLLSVFMIFKISFSLINFLVNPDLIADKAKGGGALIKNIIITFVLIITVPFAFDLLYRAQSVIISDGIIQKYILGGDLNEAGYSITMDEDHCDKGAATTDKVGDYIGLMAFRPFFQISEDSIASHHDDFDGSDGIKDMYCMANTNKNAGKASVSNILKGDDVYSAPHGISYDNYYVVEYTIFISGAVGIVFALLFLTFCFDIAVRSIKLAFLELIAPIPIISYIDPDSSKNGMFKKWVKEVFNTWLSLFMRLAAIYFAIYIIGMIADMDIPGNSLWIKLLIIIGALIFAKQLPKLLENILGIKLGESFTLNPLKKVGNEALGGKLVTGAAVAGVGLAANGVAQSASNMYAFGRDKWNLKKAIQNEKDDDKREKLQRKYDLMTTGRFAATAAGGLIGGARRGAASGFRTGQKGSTNVAANLRGDLKSGNKSRNNRTAVRNFNNELKYQKDSGKIDNDQYKQQRYSWLNRNVEENLDRETGVKNEYGGYGFYDKQISDLERKIGNNDQQENALRTAAAQYCANKGIDFTAALKNWQDNGSPAPDTALQTQLIAIDNIDKDTKQLKAQRKGFQEMQETRQNIQKDK